MKFVVRRLALIAAALLSTLPARCVQGDVLDIILRSNDSMHSGNSVRGLSIELINGSATSLEAVSLVNVSTLTQFRLTWYKDGDVVNVPLSPFCEGKNATVRCSLNLSISAVNGSKAGNYSVQLHRNELMAAANVKIMFRDAQAISFTDFPTGVVNCSSENSSLTLSYSAVGFPAPMYQLTCRGWQYTSEPSMTGKFVIPPEVCCAGAICSAVALSSRNVVARSADVIVKEQPAGPVCRQHVGCLSSRLEVLVQSCMSANSGTIVNGRTISIADDDSTAALEAVVYRNISSFEQVRLVWLKDNRTVDTYLTARSRHCEGTPSWGSWILCRLRLPLSAVNGSRSGNYTVKLQTSTRYTATAWVVVTVGGQGSQNCSSSSEGRASVSVSPRFPFTCGPYSYSQTPAFDNNDSVTVNMTQMNVMSSTADASLSNRVSLIVSTVTLGTMVAVAILAYVACKRAGSFHKQITQKYFTVPTKSSYCNDSVLCDADRSSMAANADSDLDQACIERSRDVGLLGGLLFEQTTLPLHWTGTFSNAADVEIDGVATSVMAESALHNEGASLPSAFAWNQYDDQQPPAAAERSIVHDPSMYAIDSEHKPSITFIIHAENIQVGSNNTMFVQKGPRSSATDSTYGSTQDMNSCSSSLPAFDECGLAKDSADLPLPESRYCSQVEQQSCSCGVAEQCS